MNNSAKRDKRPAFQFYPGDWLSSSSVQLMTPAEEGAYIRLLSHAWMAPDCSLPDDDESLAELSRLRGQWSKSASKLRRQFESREGRLYNKRLIEERLKQDEWRAKASGKGRLGAERRWGKDEESDATGMPQASEENARGIDQALPNACGGIVQAMPKNGSSVFSLQSSIKPLHPADAAVKRVAGEIHCRHPSIRRDISHAQAEKRLRAILKFKGVIREEWESYLEKVNRNHRVLCESYGWTKDGGEFAKGLRNWLAPTEERYENAPPVTSSPQAPRMTF